MTTIGSLFSGIGGLELGLERALSARTVWQVEADPFCRQVLAKHWPEAIRHDDVCAARNLPYVDVICGGFPCQDISAAGKGAGIERGARSGLWREFARIVQETQPRFVVVENVAIISSRGLARVIRDLDGLGYMGTWDMVSACSVGAPHLRRRIFVVAARSPCGDLRQEPATNADGSPRQRGGFPSREYTQLSFAHGDHDAWSGWFPASTIRRVDDGVSPIVDGPRKRRPRLDGKRLKALGNAVVPQVSEVVGRVVLQMMQNWNNQTESS